MASSSIQYQPKVSPLERLEEELGVLEGGFPLARWFARSGEESGRGSCLSGDRLDFSPRLPWESLLNSKNKVVAFKGIFVGGFRKTYILVETSNGAARTGKRHRDSFFQRRLRARVEGLLPECVQCFKVLLFDYCVKTNVCLLFFRPGRPRRESLA